MHRLSFRRSSSQELLQKFEQQFESPLNALQKSFLKCFENVTFKDIVKISSVLCRSKNHKKGVYESQNHDLSNYFCGVFNVYMRSDIDKIKSTSKMLFDNNQITRENSYIVSFLKLLTDKFDLCEAINIVSEKLVIKKSRF